MREATFTKQDPFFIEPMNETAGKILIEGNAAAAIGCMMAGVTVVAWYPITPSSSLCESLIGYMKRYRMDKATGKATFAIVQAEDEIASLGMVIGAGWAGARAMTATAGPGHLADVRIRRAGLLRRNARRDLRRAACRPVDRAADAHRAGRSAPDGVPLARRHQAHHDASGVGRGMLRDGAAGVRSQRAVPDADLRDDGPRPRHEQLDVRGVQVSRQADQPRQAPDEGSAGAPRRVGPLSRRRRRRHSVPHHPGRRHARLFHARLGPQRQGPVQRTARRLRREHGSARPQVRNGAEARAEADRRTRRRRQDRLDRATARRTGRSPRAAISYARRPTSRRRISGCAAIRSPRISRRSSMPTSGSTSSSRTATRSSCS